MRKEKIFIIFILMSIYTYSATNFNFNKQLIVIYKVLDPLSVIVDTPEKMIVKKGTQSFKYSEVTSSGPLNIKIEAPYNTRDKILDKIYGTATLELQNAGIFELIETTNPNLKIDGQGFFPTEGESSYRLSLPLDHATIPNTYQAATTVDAIFNKNNKVMLMGKYKGVLILDVTYGD